MGYQCEAVVFAEGKLCIEIQQGECEPSIPLVRKVISPRPPPDHQTFHHLLPVGGLDVFGLVRGRELAHLHYLIRLIMLQPVARISFILLQEARFCDLHRFQSRIFICFSLVFLLLPSVPGIHRRALLTLV